MWWAKFILLITVTVGVTTLIVWVDSRIKKSRKINPELYRHRSIFHAFVYVMLNLRDLF
jgi:hypothetical protein